MSFDWMSRLVCPATGEALLLRTGDGGEAVLEAPSSRLRYPMAQGGFAVIPGGHPIPTEASVLAGNAAFDLASSLTERDLLICLISGGGSALMTSPQRGLQLADLQSLTKSLLAYGARAAEIGHPERDEADALLHHASVTHRPR